MLLFWIIIPLFIAYSVLVIHYWVSWDAIAEFTLSGSIPPNKLTVIVPARNEAMNIRALLTALRNQSIPKDLVEVIVIDDHSEDATAAIVREFPEVRMLQLDDDSINSYKKKAIEAGIAASTAELIVCTDADCVPVNTWLEGISSYIQQHGSTFLCAPVVIDADRSLLQVFQCMDFMVLQGITGAVVSKREMSMCNGANLAYEKKAYYDVNGFAGIDHIASGDDMLLMHKIWNKDRSKVHYIKSKQAIVHTRPATSWKEFINQRIRWSSKARLYDDKRILPVLLLVYLVNLSFLVLAIIGIKYHQYWVLAGILWIAKTLVELPFYNSLARFFDKQWTISWFFWLQPLHIFYTIIAGTFGQFGRYEWKGRKVK